MVKSHGEIAVHVPEKIVNQMIELSRKNVEAEEQIKKLKKEISELKRYALIVIFGLFLSLHLREITVKSPNDSLKSQLCFCPYYT